MIEHPFKPEMMYEREKQLIKALLDCAGVCYDINFTQNKILGNPIQIVDGVEYPILELIGKETNCPYTDIVDYWSEKMPKDEAEPYRIFSDTERIKARYAAGERILRHKFWTYDVLGNSMLAEQKVILYQDLTNGDLLGLAYVSNGSEAELSKRKEVELSEQYREATNRVAILQKASANVPGGYHRCSIKKGYPFVFISKSFEQLVGYTKEQIETELDNKFTNLVYEEDLPVFANLERDIAVQGNADVIYRIRRRDGQIRWIQDSSLSIEWNGEICLQCTIADITDFVNKQQAFAKERAEFEELAENIPCGYHRCTTDGGFLLSFVSDSFLETVGYTKEEILWKPFLDLVSPLDRDFFMSHESELVKNGKVDLAYRIRRKDGEDRWIKDSTMKVEQNGKEYYQCILADITDFVNQQEEIQRKNMELMKKESFMEVVENSMPGGYHRCKAEKGCPFTYIGSHFIDIVGFTREEIENDFGNLYRNLVWEADIDKMTTYEDMLDMRGKGNVYDNSVYRLKHKDGGYRWVSDSTMFIDLGEDSFFQAVISDITPYIEALNAARKEAEASNMAKSTFLFNASHDIRTPMNAIKGFARIIEDNPSDEEKVSETVKKIQLASDTLMSLMNDILDLARIERGKEEVNVEAVNLKDNDKNLYQMFEESMSDGGVDFKIESRIDNERVLCDALKLTRIRMNMLSNAKKFTPNGGSVVFGVDELSREEDKVTYRFYTRDTGIGMSEEFKKKAFEQFERERTSTESGVSGSGLGLAIIKRLTELMGGRVEINSELGKGTEISAILTMKVIDAVKVDNKHLMKTELDMKGKRVLLVEDNAFNREIARYVLEGMNLEVDEAENGLVCVNKLIKAEPSYYDLVLMDIQMPVMDGYTATAQIRNHENPLIASLPIIAMTANAFDEDKKKCLDAGMNGHIGKPIDLEALTEELSKVFF